LLASLVFTAMRSKASVARLRLCVAKKARLASHFLLRKKKPEAMKQKMQ
jgi:hypothetical protein